MRALLPTALGLVLSAAACGGGRDARSPGFDSPIPAAERRAVLKVTVDLEPVSDCDERFDLSLYEDRGVELISWDDARGCTGRRAEVRYVPGRISKEQLLQRIRKSARRAEVSEGS